MTISTRMPLDLPSLREATRSFIRDEVIPLESEGGTDLHEATDLRSRLQEAARRAGVFGPQIPSELGGLGLNRTAQTQILEEAGYSLLGPLALNCAAPDEGNIHLLDVIANEDQRERYLVPLAAGHISSCFAMTEPAPGAGSDPSLLATAATRVEGGWSITGRKWFITGASKAAAVICMARTSGEPSSRHGATMFLLDAEHPGIRIDRNVATLDQAFYGGHGELTFNNCRVGDDAVLGEVDNGFVLAQVRLAPARITHCMRWLGIAQRSQDIAATRANERTAFGHRLAELGMVQQMIADSEIDLTASRALVREAAAVIDAGEDAGHISSITKAFVAEAIWRIVDRSVQVCGALGISEDIPLSTFLREVRPFRIYDGPTETHRWAIARRVLGRARQVDGG